MRTLARVALLALGLALVVAPASARSPVAGSWRGTFSLPRALPISVQLTGGTARVTLPGGHPASTGVSARVTGSRVRITLPGRPTPLVLDGRLRGAVIRGTVSQAGVRGRFTLRKGRPLDRGGIGVYRLASGDAVSVVRPGDTPLLIDYSTDEIHGLFRRTTALWDIGSGLGVRAPVAGSATFASGGLDISLGGETEHGRPLPLREEEVRFRSGGTTLAGTLSVPLEPGRHPAVVLVHGSGATPRTDGSVWAGYFASRGFAVLTYDKRGIALSGGRYPGEAASPAAVDTYARDAQAATRFLAAQPEVDTSRVGLSGASQAGWIMPLAASREPAVRFLVLVSGPTVTEGEQQTYQDLTTEGASPPALSPSAILAEVRRRGPYGTDPLPSIRALRIPALWLFGATDQHIPTELSVERLAPIAADPAHDFAYVVFPHADHFLIESAHGLVSETLASHHYAAGVFSTVDDWLRRRSIAASASG